MRRPLWKVLCIEQPLAKSLAAASVAHCNDATKGGRAAVSTDEACMAHLSSMIGVRCWVRNAGLAFGDGLKRGVPERCGESVDRGLRGQSHGDRAIGRTRMPADHSDRRMNLLDSNL